MENCKSFVIVLLQSQILWHGKNAVGVINLEKLFVHEPPPKRMHASLKMAQLFLFTALFSVTQAWTATKKWFPGFVDLQRDGFALCCRSRPSATVTAGLKQETWTVYFFFS